MNAVEQEVFAQSIETPAAESLAEALDRVYRALAPEGDGEKRKEKEKKSKRIGK